MVAAPLVGDEYPRQPGCELPGHEADVGCGTTSRSTIAVGSTGDIVRLIVWGPTQAAAAERFCTDNTVALEGSYFYADGGEDVPLTALVGHPQPCG